MSTQMPLYHTYCTISLILVYPTNLSIHYLLVIPLYPYSTQSILGSTSQVGQVLYGIGSVGTGVYSRSRTLRPALPYTTTTYYQYLSLYTPYLYRDGITHTTRDREGVVVPRDAGIVGISELYGFTPCTILISTLGNSPVYPSTTGGHPTPSIQGWSRYTQGIGGRGQRAQS